MMDFRASARGYASQHDPRGAAPPRAAGAPPEPTGRLLTDRSAYMQYLEVRPAPPSRPAPLDVSSSPPWWATSPGGCWAMRPRRPPALPARFPLWLRAPPPSQPGPGPRGRVGFPRPC